MKRMIRLLPLLLIAALTLSCFCLAEEESLFREDLWRITDKNEQLTEEQRNEIDNMILERVKLYEIDFPFYIHPDLSDETLPEFGEALYKDNSFGYGEDKECLFLVADMSKDSAVVLAFGVTTPYSFTQEERDAIAANFLASYKADGCAAATKAYFDDVFTYFTNDTKDHDALTAVATEKAAAETAAETEAMPDWYPEDVSSFKDFHTTEDTPRVVDNADIFTDAEEAAFTEKLTEMRKRLGADFVLFTDVSTHGMRRSIYSADFYTFNGYGVGDDFNGMILFICMEPGNRGWWEAGTGACEKLFTEKNVNALDDRLEPYMKDGEYAEGVMNFFTNLDTLFTKGRLPVTAGSVVVRALLSSIIALIVILIVRGVMRGKMKVVRKGSEADAYLVRDTFKLRSSHDYFLRTETTRQKIERSSGGGSSYSGGYSSSSGRSFSGGGRSF